MIGADRDPAAAGVAGISATRLLLRLLLTRSAWAARSAAFEEIAFHVLDVPEIVSAFFIVPGGKASRPQSSDLYAQPMVGPG
jgi:hypothetical protein